MARLSLSLLGPLEATLDGEPVTGFDSNKVRALLAYLAIEAGRAHRRETLAGLLWPDWPERSARTNLRNALSRLRAVIGDRDAEAERPHLLVTRETIQFNVQSDHWVDVTAFDGLLQAGSPALEQCEQAIALYRGPFLEGFSLADCPAYEDWAFLVREQVQREMLAALQWLVEHYEIQGEHERACEHAWRWVELAPWQEQAHQELMRLLALSGRRGAALAQYEACRRALREELDVEPGEETRRLYERIRDGDLAPPRQEADTGAIPTRTIEVPSHSPAPPPRSDELPPSPQPPLPMTARARPVPIEGQRRIITALLADVKGSTGLAGQIDTEDWVEILDRVFRILGTEIYRYGGEVDQFRGDGLVAFFGLPTAHEDDPERAVLAALAMQGAVKEYAAELVQREGIDLTLRVGVNTGEVIAATVGGHYHREDTAMGRAVALASRMQTVCEPGTVLVTEGTYRLVSTMFEWQALGEIEVKGVSLPLAVYRPLAPRAGPGKGRGVEGLLSPLVGRDAELRALEQAIERLQSGIGGIVTVVGEAGIGKSRLVTEALNAQPSPPRTQEGRCLSYTTTIAYQVWLDMVRGLLEVAPDAPPSAVREALERWVRALCPDCYEDVYPYMARMMSLSLDEEAEAVLRGLGAQGLKASTFRAVELLVERATERRPLMLVCEDLHWADPTSLALLERLLPLVDRAPLLLVAAFRPQTEHGCWRIKEIAARDYSHRHTDLWLAPLSTAASETLVGNLLPLGSARDTPCARHVEDLPRRLRDRVLDHAEGNPFFLEEILRSLIDGGIIAHDEVTGRWYATRDVSDIPIPDTLYGTLTARIDRLDQETKRILQLASVIGRIFTYPVLSAIAGDTSPPEWEGYPTGEEGDGLLPHLVALERAQLIRERARLPEREYIFKHHLTQEAAFNGLLKRERRVYHRQVAEALERLYAERIEEQLGLLAQHWEHAREPVKAVPYLLRAGEQARTAYANEEAIAYFRRALALCAPLSAAPGEGSARAGCEPAWRLEALKGLGRIYEGTGKLADAEASLHEAIVLGRRAGLAAREMVWLYHYLGEVMYWQGRWDERIRIGEEGLALLGDDSESVETALMNQMIAVGYGSKGDYEKSQAFTLRTAQFLKRLPYTEELRAAYDHVCLAYIRNKDIEEALKWSQLLEELATTDHDLRAVQSACHTGGGALALIGDLAGAIAQYQRALELSIQIGDLGYQFWCLAGMGAFLLWLGDVQNAQVYADRALEAVRAMGREHNIALGYVITGLVSVIRHDWDKAVSTLQRAAQLLQESGPRWWQVWATFVLGQALLARQDRAEALRRFREALALLDTEMLKGYPFVRHIWNTVTMNPLVANVLGGLERAREDAAAFRASCDPCRGQTSGGPFVQWYLEPAEPREDCVLRTVDVGWGPDDLQNLKSQIQSGAWIWQDPFGDCSFSVRNGIEIKAANGRDLWIHNLSAPRMLRPASGEWAIQTACLPLSNQVPTIGGLLLWKDKQNYLRLDRGPAGERELLFRGCLENQDIVIGRGQLPPERATGQPGRIHLRLERAAEHVSAFCSADGEQWFTVGHVTLPVEDPVQVGVHASGNIDRTVYHGAYPDGTAIRFESFQLWV